MRFMHIADVHLGALPDVGAPWSGDRGKELWQTFEKCIGEARARKVDLLLIAGDLFHRQPRGRELQEVNTLFSSLSGTIVVLMAGNHDYLKPSSPYWISPGEKTWSAFLMISAKNTAAGAENRNLRVQLSSAGDYSPSL